MLHLSYIMRSWCNIFSVMWESNVRLRRTPLLVDLTSRSGRFYPLPSGHRILKKIHASPRLCSTIGSATAPTRFPLYCASRRPSSPPPPHLHHSIHNLLLCKLSDLRAKVISQSHGSSSSSCISKLDPKALATLSKTSFNPSYLEPSEPPKPS
jgi:hypothetical protein